MPIGTIIARPLRTATWRELGYLLLGGLVSVVAFAEVVGMWTVGVTLMITLVGVPVFLLKAYLERGLAAVERARAGFLLGERIEGRYRDASSGGLWHRLRVVAIDPQTWRDALWAVLVSVIGFAFAVAAASLWFAALWMLTYPSWWWLLPDSWLPEQFGPDRRVDTWPLALAEGGAGLVATVLVAWICAGLAQAQAHLARALLRPTLQERVDELTRTRAGAVDAQADELERIERDLHDGAQARLVSLAMELGRARDKLGSDPEAAATLVASAHDEAKTALVELRELVRGVHPAVLTDRGLDAALSALAARSPVPVALDVRLHDRMPRPVERAAYFVVAEALANVAKHSDARAVSVEVVERDRRLELAIADDGIGGADPADGTGLAGLARRVEALDGTFVLESPRGGPTRLQVVLPCAP